MKSNMINDTVTPSMNLTFISVLRSVSILIVVFFHTYGYMYAQAHFPKSIEAYRDLYFTVNQCVFINIAMSLFTAISGYLFAYLHAQGKYQNFWPLIKKKALRLLLPFFIFGTLMMLTIGIPFRPWKLYTGDFLHLWYLPALFWCFPVGWIIQRYCKNHPFFLSAAFIGLLFINNLSKYAPCILGIQGTIRYYEWFLLGQILALYHTPLFSFINKWHLGIPLLLPFSILSWIFPDPYEMSFFHSRLMVSAFLVGLFALFESNPYLSGENKAVSFAVWFSKYSFGIYIFHNWVGPYMISRTAKRLFPLETLASEHTILFPFVLSLTITAVSLVLSYGLMKTRIGKMLIG